MMAGSFHPGDLMDLDSLSKPTEHEEVEEIPPLRNLAGHIFVPVNFDFTTASPLQGRMQRLEHILRSVDFHRQGSRENLYHMFDREKQRIINEARAMEKLLGQDYRPALTQEEENLFLANMSAPADPNKDYNVKTEDVQPLKQAIRPEPADKPLPVREKTVRDLMILIESSISELDSFENAMKGIKDKYILYVEKEKATGSTVDGVRVSGDAVESKKRHRRSGDHPLDVSGKKVFSEPAKHNSSSKKQQRLLTPKYVPSPLSKSTVWAGDEILSSSKKVSSSTTEASLTAEQTSRLSKKALPFTTPAPLPTKTASVSSGKATPTEPPSPTKQTSLLSRKTKVPRTQASSPAKPAAPFPPTAAPLLLSTTPAPQKPIQNPPNNTTPQPGYMSHTSSSNGKKRSIRSLNLQPVAGSPSPPVIPALSTPTPATTITTVRPEQPIPGLPTLSISTPTPTPSGGEKETRKRVSSSKKKKTTPPNSNCLAGIFADASNVAGEEGAGGEKKEGYEALSPRSRRAAQERQWREGREERQRGREREEEREREREREREEERARRLKHGFGSGGGAFGRRW
ncbi:hypothetical protein QBC41DRAFT_369201 [Cercophora samala]|uniref:Uncharacterized protein n=1 Tax=Cercophora samala TaxID=330535 RepID=A0AA40CXU2_9PEZI|nr:hypothetical protein QBC41DRAFT_369201 [Cercophora samala]